MEPKQFWNYNGDELIKKLNSSSQGLPEAKVKKRLAQQLKQQKVRSPLFDNCVLLGRQFKSPLVLLLVFAVLLSAFLKEYSNSIIILAVLILTGLLGFVQEKKAGKAVEKLRALVHNRALVKRAGVEKEILIEKVVKGDIVLLSAGDIIPADCFLLESNDLHVNESALTGESFPVEKFPGLSEAKDFAAAANSVFKGTSVISGTAVALAVQTGDDTELGKIALSLQNVSPITSFEKGISKFGNLLLWITVVFSGIILVSNLFFDRPFFDSLLFALALAVGITPELLPAIVTITLAAGAKRMAAQKMIVKKLSAIQNLGEIDILCSDKTGTITQGVVELHKTEDVWGRESQKILLYAYLNAFFETGFSNPIDQAIRQHKEINISGYNKADEVPYDFMRKRLSIVVEKDGRHLMITKGAFQTVLDISAQVEEDGRLIPLDKLKNQLQAQFAAHSDAGFRVIAIGYKDVSGDPVINKDDETGMTFLGFLVFSDPLKEGIVESISALKAKGVSLKIISGDNYKVAQYIAGQVGLDATKMLTGTQVAQITFDDLVGKAAHTDVFAEILPVQKESIIKALQKSGHTVGYLGDGINDANALKAADVGISVQAAVDVAKEAADLVLLDRHIDVINNGIMEGRKTFMNTLKYIFVTTSANFGNMVSMAVASLLLPFMPLLPVQILLNNFLSDLPAIGIGSDKVDVELIQAPRRWDIRYIKRFMVAFGLQSSLFDFATFALLYFVFKATPEAFRTAWFIESLLTEILILLVIRTKRPFFKSSPSRYLVITTILTFVICVLLPYLPFAGIFEFYPLPLILIATILFITVLYFIAAEQSKKYLFKKL